MQTLLRCPYSPCVLSHVSTAVQTLKTANFGGITMNGQREILQTLIGMGSAALAAAVFHPGKATRVSHKGQRGTKTNKQKP